VAHAKSSRAPAPARPHIVFEDSELLVADKPAGLLSVGTDRERRRTLFRQLLDRERRRRGGSGVFVVHRLDRDASGLLVFAKSEGVQRELQRQFRERSAGRTYRAVVQGCPAREQHVFESYLAENRALNVYVTSDPRRGKPAVTRLRVLRRGRSTTLVEIALDTGRKHQIRVHLAAAGHPLLGDRRYGAAGAGPLGRLALHAVALEFDHPATGSRLRFESPMPRSFLAALRRTR